MLMGGHGCVVWSLFRGCCGIVAIGVHGQSFVAVGDHCGQLSLFVLVAVGSLSVMCVVGGGKRKKATSRMITKQGLFVMRHN